MYGLIYRYQIKRVLLIGAVIVSHSKVGSHKSYVLLELCSIGKYALTNTHTLYSADTGAHHRYMQWHCMSLMAMILQVGKVTTFSLSANKIHFDHLIYEPQDIPKVFKNIKLKIFNVEKCVQFLLNV